MKNATEVLEKDLKRFTLKGQWNHETKKPYVEVLRDGEHYCFMPWSTYQQGKEV